MRTRIVIAAALVSLCSHGLVADVRTEQKTHVQFAGMLGRVVNLFGGKAAREGLTSTVIVKGDRKVTTSGTTSQIIDLAEEKFYDLDLRRQTYRVTTFDQVRRELQEAQRKADEQAQKEEPDAAPEDAPADQKEVEVDFDVKKTGESKVVNGFDTTQTVLTITVREKGKTLEQGGGLVLTSDMWLAPEQPAMAEVAAFDRRYAQTLYRGVDGVSPEQMAAAIAMYPMVKQAIEKMNAEDTKVEGTAIMTTLTFDAVPPADAAASESQAEAQPAPGRGLGGMLGGLARKVRKNNDPDPKTRSSFMTSTVQVLSIGTDVAAADVAVPAGFKERK